VAKMLALFVDDPDPRVREVARASVDSGKLPSYTSAAKE
jgi:hypothetical protein